MIITYVCFILSFLHGPAVYATGRKIRTAVIYIPLFFILLIPAVDARGDQNRMSVYYPPDRSVMEYDLLGIVLTIPEGTADRLEVSVNGDTKNIRIDPQRRYQCFTVRLSLGINRIVIIAEGDDDWIDTAEFNVFRHSSLIGQYQEVPPGYKKDHFHIKTRDECSRCHTLIATESDRKPVRPETFRERVSAGAFDSSQSTCISCHKEIAEYPHVHGPVSVWSCLSCHDPEARPVYSVQKPVSKVCYQCHAADKKKWSAKKHIHGPVNLGNCTICHSPHGSKYRYNLYLPVWNLCTNCHAEKASGEHVLSGDFSSGGHPTHNRKDPLRRGRELTCASCHDPHASNSPNMWAFDVKDVFHLCLKCHKNK